MINEEIRLEQIRLIGSEGEQLGIVSIEVNLVDIGIAVHQNLIPLSHQKMYGCAGNLLLYGTNYRCGEHNVSNGTESDNEDFLGRRRLLIVHITNRFLQ